MPPRRRAAHASRHPQVFNTAASAFIFLAVDKDLRGRLERDWCARGQYDSESFVEAPPGPSGATSTRRPYPCAGTGSAERSS